MNLRLPKTFRLLNETESFEVVRNNVEKDSVFHGTNLWVLFFAILIASLGLNINSAAVVIGAMLISPLMGPILGIGIGVATNHLPLIKKAFRNYLFAAMIGLIASTIYFLLTPLDKAHSEILSRTSPTIYDVLIALFGGFAGSIAISSKHKGNVIPGVAIATALMPPLCTAGYGIATWQLNYFFGAFYLYLINSVFIGAATITTAYLLKYPVRQYEDPKIKRKEKAIIWVIIIATLIPSIYLGYVIVQQHRFTEEAERFISSEAHFENDYLLKKEIDPKTRSITLTFGGEEIRPEEIEVLRAKMKYFNLEDSELEVKQGFAFLQDNGNDEELTRMGMALGKAEVERMRLKSKVDSVNLQRELSRQIFMEIKVNHPALHEAVIEPAQIHLDTTAVPVQGFVVLLSMTKAPDDTAKKRLGDWLNVRLGNENVKMVIEEREREKTEE